MASAIAVDYGPRFAVRDGLDCCIKHGVHQISIRLGPDGPTNDKAVEAVDDGRKINLTSADVEFGDVSQPFLIRSGRVEVSIDNVLRCRADLAEV